LPHHQTHTVKIKIKAKKGDLNATPQEPAHLIPDFDGDSDDEMADPAVLIGEDSNCENQYPGFSRNPLLINMCFFNKVLSHFCI
jgi:hypothetical protein